MPAIGVHGTRTEAAQRILASGFQISRNEYDWLGDGAYFFQDAPVRAMEWARERFGDKAAVIGAEIDLEDGIDLLDIPWERLVLRAEAFLLTSGCATSSLPCIIQRAAFPGGRGGADCRIAPTQR